MNVKPATRPWITSIIASSPSTPGKRSRASKRSPDPTRKRVSQHQGVTGLLPTAQLERNPFRLCSGLEFAGIIPAGLEIVFAFGRLEESGAALPG